MEDIKLCILKIQNRQGQSPKVFPNVVKLASGLNLDNGFADFGRSFLSYEEEFT